MLRLGAEPQSGAILAALGIIGGGLMLNVAAWLGENHPDLGFPWPSSARVASGTGLLIGARFVIPVAVAGLSGLLGHDPASVVVRRNALLDRCTTRVDDGLVIRSRW